jgi:voltage-gated potassium channel Kch
MLYFSAMTITTVGFGDIVPISDRTRLLTAAEAVSGIIVIGLFLNSLAQQIAKKDR